MHKYRNAYGVYAICTTAMDMGKIFHHLLNASDSWHRVAASVITIVSIVNITDIDNKQM